MTLSLARLQRIAATPFDSATQRARFVVDTSDDSMTLPAGVYTLSNAGAVAMYLCINTAAAVPADKAALAPGFALAPGAATQLVLDASSDLHAIVATGSADLLIMKQAV
mgnify:CR=1 FL=1